MTDLQIKDKQYISNTYARFPVDIIRGDGSLLYDSDGKEYIDMGSGIGVTAFGISDKIWKEAIIEQLEKVQHTSNLYYTEPCVLLAELICKKTEMSKVFFANSGAEANECAIKVARKYAADNKGEDYYNIITLNNSFHGRTLTTLAATGQEHFHKLFNPLTPGFIHCDANDFEQLEDAVKNNKIAGIMLECVQGEGGVISLDSEYIKKVRKLADQHDIILIIDEVQTGNGRTGTLYSYMNFGIKPDVFTTAKGLGGGLPIGACVMSEKVENVLGYGDHGSTYGANPVACAGAVTVIERLDDEFLEEVKSKSKYVFDKLSKSEGVLSVSGLGLMVGIETKKPASEVVKGCIEKGVLCLTAKSKVRLLPALNIPMDVLDKALDIIIETCKC